MSGITTPWDTTLYHEKHAYVYEHGADLIRWLDPKANERILDLGCGLGQLTSRIHPLAKEVIGLDKSPEMIAEARLKFPDIRFVVGDAEHFKFDAPFDSIFSNATLHWVQKHERAIKCMYESLKPNGKVVLEFGGKGNVQTIIQSLRDVLRARGYARQSELDLWYFPTIGAYATKLEHAGFRVLLAEHFDRPTRLADEENGIKDWLAMFAGSFFMGIGDTHIEKMKTEVQEKVKNKCLRHGKWWADYKRIRILAVKANTD